MERIRSATFWTAVAVTLLSAVPLGANRPLTWVALSLVLLALFVVQAAVDLRSSEAARAFRPLAPAALLYVAAVGWAVVQALPGLDPSSPVWSYVEAGGVGSISLNPDMTWQHVLRALGYAAAFWIAVRGAADPDRALRVIDVVAIWTAIIAVYGLAAHFSGVNPIRGTIDAYPESVTATFVNRNTYAFYAGIGMMAGLAAFMRRATEGVSRFRPEERRRAWRIALERVTGPAAVFLLAAGANGFAMALTQSRAGVASALAGAVIMIMSLMLRRRGFVKLLVPLLLVFAAVVTIASSSRILDRVESVGINDSARLEVYALTLHGIADRPLLGHGLGAFQEGFRPYATRDLASFDYDLAHSVYLETAFELGLPAAAALMLALALIGWRIWRGVRVRRRMTAAPALALGAFVAGALHSLVDFSLQIPAVATLFALLLGMGWIQSWSSMSSVVAPDRPAPKVRGRSSNDWAAARPSIV